MIARPPAASRASHPHPTRRLRSAGKKRNARNTQLLGASEREALLARHVGLVHHVARQLANRLSTAVELEDLIGAGALGLMQAADSFDPARGLSFSTYAVPRIRGAILDELRKQDHMPRNVRRRTRDVSRAREALSLALRREPSETEMCRYVGVSPEVMRQWELDAEGGTICSLNQPVGGNDGATLADTLADERAEGASLDELLGFEQEVERVKRAIADLKEQERIVIAMNFFEELKLQQIAAVLGLSVCRISQIRTAALSKLRQSLSELRAA